MTAAQLGPLAGVKNLDTIVDGTLKSSPNAAYELQFFANDLPESSGYGEGKTLLGSFEGTTDAGGELPFHAVFSNFVVNPGQTVTAIAINGDQSIDEKDIYEFLRTYLSGSA